MQFRHPLRQSTGFSLVELSIVVVIAAILLTMGISSLTIQSENIAFSLTRNRQQTIGEALSGYFARNGRLPCPDLLAGGNIIGRGDDNRATPENVTTPCAADTGVLPYIDLGLPRDTVLDGWESYFTYRVTTDPIVALDWTRSSPSIIPGKAAKLIVSERNPASSITPIRLFEVPNAAVYVLISHGKNGLGATTAQGTVNVAPAAGSDELLNATGGVTAFGFVRRDITAGTYDDIVSFGTADKLIAPLVKDGTVKSSEGATQKALSDMVDLVTSQSISAATLPSFPVMVTDGWGTTIVYTRSYGGPITLTLPASNANAFRVTSYGPDRLPGADDIVFSVTTDSLKLLYAKAGTLLP